MVCKSVLDFHMPISNARVGEPRDVTSLLVVDPSYTEPGIVVELNTQGGSVQIHSTKLLPKLLILTSYF